MKITPEISAIKNAYLKAKSANDSQEMNRLKAKGMEIVNQQKASADVKIGSRGESGVTNEHGDRLEIGAGRTTESS